jgi:GT2 family glycosyltransferase
MIPHEADPATELFHWQRYLYFRPWYVDAKVIDAASGEGYGLGYAATFAKQAEGFDIAPDAVRHARSRYPHSAFNVADVCNVDYSDADLVTSFETIEHLPDPRKFLKALSACKGRIVISTPNRDNHSPGNKLSDKPFNQYHTIEWTPEEFAELIRSEFPDRQVRFLSQENRWPGLVREGLDSGAKYTIAVIGDGELPKWPRIGLSMPTCNQAQRVHEAIYSLGKFYPGEIEFAVVANGSTPETIAKLKEIEADIPHVVRIFENSRNLGYGQGANRGIEELWTTKWYDLFGVINDDVLPAVDCVCQMVAAITELDAAGQKPGLIGPVSNSVNGRQQVDIGNFASYKEMVYLAELYHRDHHSSATQVNQLRGLFFLMTPECLNEIGGFDPRFGLGNFEDDDLNVRARLAGYTIWIADGAFLYHVGSSTFRALGLDYTANITRNLGLLIDKWGVSSLNEALTLNEMPADVSLFIPLTAKLPSSNYSITINKETIDLVHQASDAEFATYLAGVLRDRPRADRLALLEAIGKPARKTSRAA